MKITEVARMTIALKEKFFCFKVVFIFYLGKLLILMDINRVEFDNMGVFVCIYFIRMLTTNNKREIRLR